MDEEQTRVRVYKYGLLPPTENEELVNEQLYLAHAYKNALIAVIRRGRQDYNQIIKVTAGDDLELQEELRDDLAERVKLQRAELSSIKASAGKRVRDRTPESQALIRELSAQIKKQNAALTVVKDRISAIREKVKQDPRAQAGIEALNAERWAAKKREYNLSSAWWGSKLKVREALDQIEKTKKGGLPKFRRWLGESQLAVQIHKSQPLNPEGLFACDDRRLRVQPVPQEAWTSESRSVRRRLSRTVLQIRLGSRNKKGEMVSGGNTPVFASFPMIMHRPLPDSQITWAQVVRRKTANRTSWHVCLTVKEPEPVRTDEGEGLLAIDIGWRRTDEGIRVAYWYDGRDHGEVIVPNIVIGAIDKVDLDVKSRRDKAFNAMRDRLLEWKKGRVLPEWLRKALTALHLWRSQKRLARVVLQWRKAEERPDDDIEILTELEAWRKQDKHLWQWECSGRKKACRRRREIYRIWASEVARKYSGLALENIRLDVLAKRKHPETGDDLAKKARRQRDLVCAHELIGALKAAFGNAGKRVVRVAAQYTTRTCHVCGIISLFADPGAQIQTCKECGATWDRDHNAAVNIHARGLQEMQTTWAARKRRKAKFHKRHKTNEDVAEAAG